MRVARLTPAALALALAGIGASSPAATLPVSVPILLDGDVSDWQPVLANPVNSAWDGDGSSVACLYSNDRDCQVLGNEHDLARFAWTWSATSFYFYFERYGNGAPWAYFAIHFDTDWDGLMETNEPVFFTRLNSVGTSVNPELARYRASLPGGDPLADAQSLADGYDMQGQLNSGPALTSVVPVPGGLIVEGSLTWAQLGIAANAPMKFHVSAASSTNLPAAVRDNMGGAGGRGGDTGFRAVSLGPVRDVSGAPGQTTWLLHQACNLGNVPARMDVVALSATGYDVTFWRDNEGDGFPDLYLGRDSGGDGDFTRSRDDLSAAGDSDADRRLDLGVLGAGECAWFVLEQTYPQNSNSSIERLSVRVSEQADPTALAELIDNIRIGKITLRADRSLQVVAGDFAWFPHVIQNNTATSERIDLRATSTRGWTYAFFLDPNRDGDPSDASPLADNDGSGLPDVQATVGEQVHVFARATVPGAAGVGQVEIATVFAIVQGNVRDQCTDTATVAVAVDVMPDHTVANNDERYGTPGGSIYFAHRIVNSRGVRDSFNLSAVSSTGWPVTLLADPDGDGRPYDSYTLPGFTPFVGGNGGSYAFLVRVDVPVGSSTGSLSTITVTGQSRSNAALSDAATDDAFAAIVRIYEDPAHVVNIVQASGCSTIYAQANGLPPSAPDYRFVWRDGGSTGVRVTTVQTDSRGICEDQLSLTPLDTGIGWSVQIQQLVAGTWVTLDTARFDIGDSVVVSAVAAGRASYDVIGANFSATARFSNSSGSLMPAVDLRWIVKNPAGTQYLRADGTFQPFGGLESTATDSFTMATFETTTRIMAVANVAFPAEGTYVVQLMRTSSCGGEFLAGSATFTVVDDVDGDGLTAAQEIAAGTDPFDADTDDDGLLDGADGLGDSDADGAIDALDCDSDDDLILDGTEAGVWDPHFDTDVAAGCFRPDISPSATTDPDNPDTDGGGVPDGIEDSDQDGRRDAGETDPLDPADDVVIDTDGDGLFDVSEAVLGTNPNDADSDDDGVADGVEAFNDADGDGLDDALECDSDGDGLPDGLERGVTAPLPGTNVAAGCFIPDADPATTTDPGLADTDGGGMADGAEDVDRDGSRGAGERDPLDPADDDSDGDGLNDMTELAIGTSPTDRDSDDDGVIDGLESGDANADGVIDALACDSDGDGLPDGLELGVAVPDAGTDMAAGCFVPDADQATTTNPFAADTDGAGVVDAAEDANRNGRVDSGETDPGDPLDDDSDGDGLANLAEDALGTDRLDRDSDDDGVVDGMEAGDGNGDGQPDALACDSDGDGLSDGLERGIVAPDAGTDLAAGCFVADADPATLTNPFLADTDGGGVDDGAEDVDRDGARTANERDPNVGGDDWCSVAPPGEILGLLVAHTGAVAHLTWTAVADACTTYTAWTSASLPAIAPMAWGLTTAAVDDASPVGPRGVTFYLVSADSPLGGSGPTGP